MNRILQVLLSGVVFVLIIASCQKDNKENLFGISTSCDSSIATYSGEISPICINSCAVTGCHLGSTPAAGLDLSDYDDVARVANNDKLMNRLQGISGPVMPPGGPLPDCDIESFLEWVDSGAPNTH